MKKLLALFAIVLTLGSTLSFDAEAARRLGGGRSVGMQRQATPPAQAPANTATQSPTAPTAPAAGTAAAAAAPAGAVRADSGAPATPPVASAMRATSSWRCRPPTTRATSTACVTT